MKDGIKVAGAVLALVLLGCNAALLVDRELGHLEQSIVHDGQKREAANQEAKQSDQNAADDVLTIGKFSSWDLRRKASYCTKDMKEKSEVQWAQQYLCGAKYTDDKSASSSSLTVVLTVALFAVACAQAFIYWRQARIMGDQLKAAKDAARAAQGAADVSGKMLEITDRPWITVKLEAIDDLKVSKNKTGGTVASILIEFTLENVGRSPAAEIWISSRLRALGPGAMPYEQQKAFAIQEPRPPRSVGKVIFPGEIMHQHHTVEAGPDDIQTVKSYQGTVLYLMGTVTYGFGGIGPLRHTGFIYHVRKSSFRAINLSSESIESVSLDQVVIVEDELGSAMIT